MRFLTTISINLIVFLAAGCSSYYHVNQSKAPYGNLNALLTDSNHFHILHYSGSAWNLRDGVILNDTIYGWLAGLPVNRRSYRTTNTKHKNRYRPNMDNHIFDEVHLYTNKIFDEKDVDELKLSIKSIQYVERYEQNKKMSYFVLGGLVLLIIIL